MNKFNLSSLTETMNSWADGKLSEEVFADFFQFVWKKWSVKQDKTQLNFEKEFKAFCKKVNV